MEIFYGAIIGILISSIIWAIIYSHRVKKMEIGSLVFQSDGDDTYAFMEIDRGKGKVVQADWYKKVVLRVEHRSTQK